MLEYDGPVSFVSKMTQEMYKKMLSLMVANKRRRCNPFRTLIAEMETPKQVRRGNRKRASFLRMRRKMERDLGRLIGAAL